MKVQKWMKLITWTRTSGLITEVLTGIYYDCSLNHSHSKHWLNTGVAPLWKMQNTNKTWFISLKECYLWFDLSFQRGMLPKLFLFHGEICSCFLLLYGVCVLLCILHRLIWVFPPLPLQRSHSNHFWLPLVIAWRPFFLALHVLLACNSPDLECPWSFYWSRLGTARLTANSQPPPSYHSNSKHCFRMSPHSAPFSWSPRLRCTGRLLKAFNSKEGFPASLGSATSYWRPAYC